MGFPPCVLPSPSHEPTMVPLKPMQVRPVVGSSAMPCAPTTALPPLSVTVAVTATMVSTLGSRTRTWWQNMGDNYSGRLVPDSTFDQVAPPSPVRYTEPLDPDRYMIRGL